MKKVLLTISTVLLIGAVWVSCQKEENANPETGTQEGSSKQSLKSDAVYVDGYYVKVVDANGEERDSLIVIGKPYIQNKKYKTRTEIHGDSVYTVYEFEDDDLPKAPMTDSSSVK